MVENKGFTLIEILVVVGVLAIIVTMGSSMFFSILKGSTKTKTANLVKQNGDYALEVIARMIRNAKEIDENTETPPRRCELGMSKLKIKNPDGWSTEFECSGSTISSNSAAIISSQVKVDSCSFDCQSGGLLQPDVVKISFTLSQAQISVRPEEWVSINFNTTVSLRNISLE